MNKQLYKLITIFMAVAVFVSAWGVLTCGLTATATFAAAPDGTLTLHFIDCGQADACVIEFPDGKSMLIDAGENKEDSHKKIITYIKNETAIEAFDYFILTHSDADHIGGVVKVLSEFPVTTVYRPNQAADYTDADKADFDKEHYKDPAKTATGSAALRGDYATKCTNTYVNALAKVYEVADNVYVTNPNDDSTNNITGSVTVDGEAVEYTFDFYSPLSDVYAKDNNNYSPIMTLSYAGRNIVLSGDAEKENEEEFVNFVRDDDKNARYDRFRRGFNADIIKMGHHGSQTSSSEDYLEIMCANENARRNTFTIFSCGENKSYGHPHEKTLQRLMDMKFSPTRIRRTDLQGNIRFDISAAGAIAESYDKEAELSAILTCGLSSNTTTHPQVTVADNNIRPTEDTGAIEPDPTPETPSNPFLDFWNGLTPTVRILVIVIAVVVVILIVAIFIAVRVKRKKKKSKKRGRR